MAKAISLREAVFLAGRFPLLAGVDLDVAEGEVVHLRGPNGAGKTSLLRACAGLLALSAGEGEVLGHDLSGDRLGLRREVGFLGQQGFLYEDLSVLENVRFAVRAARAPLERVAPALERLGLRGRLLATPLGRLSSGQRRRTCLAVLLARSPRLWLLDEPHSALDEEGRHLVDELIGEARAAGSTVLFASHDAAATLDLSDTVVEVAGGRIVGAPFLQEAEAVLDTAVEAVGRDVA